MYTSPDYEKVTLQVCDSFAAYKVCTPNEGGNWSYEIPCEGTDDYQYEEYTYVSVGWAHMCYSNLNQPGT